MSVPEEPGLFGLKILYEDNHLIAVLKPAGLLVQGDKTGDATLPDMIRYYLKTQYYKPGKVFLGMIHRLDRPVSGMVLFAKTSKAAARLSAAFREGKVRKIYLAVCSPPPDPAEGTLEDFLLKDKEANTSTVVPKNTPGARPSSLSYSTLKSNDRNALVRIDLHTGRAHQIRVQFAHRGWPIVGDWRYGQGGDKPLALFALRLEFEHPVRHEKIEIEAEPPEGLLEI